MRADQVPKEIPEVGKGENVLVNLPFKLSKEWREIQQLNQDAVRAQHELLHLANRANAKTTLFWQEVEKLTEQTETAMSRSKLLGIRKAGIKDSDEMILVVIERNPPECTCPKCQGRE